MPLSQINRIFKNDPLSFINAYWLAPGAGYSIRTRSGQGGELSEFANTGVGRPGYYAVANVFRGRANTTDALMTLTNNRDKIAYANLFLEGGDKYAVDFFPASQVNAMQRANLLPVWFLPWWSDHVVKMKILTAGMLPPDVPDPDIFFTTALTGCSVFVEGPPHSPTIYHAGFSNTRDYTANPKLHPDSIQHWRLLFNQYSPGAVAVGEANKGQYFSGGGAMANLTPDMQAYRQFLQDEHKNQLRIEDMMGEGTVIGVRDSNSNWSFWLQESVTVICYTLRKKRRVFGKDRMVDGERKIYLRPMSVRQIYPNGANGRAWNTTRLLP